MPRKESLLFFRGNREEVQKSQDNSGDPSGTGEHKGNHLDSLTTVLHNFRTGLAGRLIHL